MWSESAHFVVSLLVTQPAGDNTSAQVGLYAMLSALGVAGITGLVTLLKPRFASTVEATPAAARKVSREHEAWERWFLLNDIDPRKIKTGYESMEAVVRRAAT